MKLRIPIGITDSGQILKQDLCSIRHLLITGKTGTGKSTLLKFILKSLDNQSCKIILIDTKGVDFNDFSPSYFLCPVITDAKMSVNYLDTLDQPDDDVVIVIDELSDLIAISDKPQQLLQNIVKMPNMYIIMATRMPSILSDDFRQTFHNQITFTDDKIGDAVYNQTHIKTKEI